MRCLQEKEGNDDTSRVNGVRCLDAAAEMIRATRPFPGTSVSILYLFPVTMTCPCLYKELCSERSVQHH